MRELHSIGLMGATRQGELSWYRGGTLQPCDPWVNDHLDNCRNIPGLDLDVAFLRHLWRSALALPEPTGRQVWLHGDLKPTNLLVREGKLHAIIDFGGISVGFPTPNTPPCGISRPTRGGRTGTP